MTGWAYPITSSTLRSSRLFYTGLDCRLAEKFDGMKRFRKDLALD
jgi:hypothetical protein